MNDHTHTLIAVFLSLMSFVFGSIPFGLLVARVFNAGDIRSKGSGNIGATNVSRVAGFWPAGALTFLLDVLKGVLPVFLAKPPGSGLWVGAFGLEVFDPSAIFFWWVGLCAVLGHCYSPWLRFKGGKGVATGFGVILVLSPLGAIAGILAFGMTMLLQRIGSLASLCGLLAATAFHLVVYPLGAHLWVGALIVAVIIYRHEKNIDDLLSGRENRF